MSVGTFTPNHVGFDALRAVVRLVRPGGILLLTIRDDFTADPSNGFNEHVAALSDSLEQLHVSAPELYTPNVSEDITFRCWAWCVRD